MKDSKDSNTDSQKVFLPRPYQPAMIEHVRANPRCGLIANMGSGKTATSLLGLLQAELEEGNVLPVLVVTMPRCVNDVWMQLPQEWVAFRDLKFIALEGTKRERAELFEQDADIYVIAYTLVPWLIEHANKRKRWIARSIIADESRRLQGFRMSGGTIQSRALAKVAHTHANRFVELTGTFASRDRMPVWGQTWFLDEGARLGRTFTDYLERYTYQPVRGVRRKFTQQSIKEVDTRIADLYLSVDAVAKAKVDKPTTLDHRLSMAPSQMAEYKRYQRGLLAEFDGRKLAPKQAMLRAGRLRQLASGAYYESDEERIVAGLPPRKDGEPKRWFGTHNVKIDELLNIFDECENEPILVAYWYRHSLERIRAALSNKLGAENVHLMARGDKTVVPRWNRGELRAMLLHPESAGHGLNLQHGGRRIVWFDIPDSYDLYAQAVDRIGPMRQYQSGYEREVFVHRLLTRGTTDDIIASAHNEHRSGEAAIYEFFSESSRRAA